MKLTPDNRESFLAALAPPPGYRVEAALGTSYSLDLPALTAAVLTLGGFEWPAEDDGTISVAEFVTARSILRDRLRIFFDQGRLTTKRLQPEAVQRSSTLDRFLVARQHGSAFHPKVWAVKYVPERGGAIPLFRFLCASRNLTTGGSWELAVMLEGCLTDKAQRFGSAVGDWLTAATGGAPLPTPLRTLTRELKTVAFTLPGTEPDQVAFLGQSPGGTSLWSQMPARFERAAVVAPFVEASFLGRLRERCKGPIKVLGTLEALFPLKDVARELEIDAYVIRDISNDAEFSLHAKLLLIDCGNEEIAFLGSANATDPAWGARGRNTEAVVRLSQVIRIDAFARLFEDPASDLRRWVQRLDEIEEGPAVDTELENAVNAVRRHARFRVEYNSLRKVYAIEAQQLPQPVKIRPLTIPADQAKEIRQGQVVLFNLPADSLTKVVVLTIGTPNQSLTGELALAVTVHGVSDDAFDQRDRRYDGHDPDALEQAILRLFSDDGGGSPRKRDQTREGSAGARPSSRSDRPPLSRLTLERVLHVCGTRPEAAEIPLRLIGGLPDNRTGNLAALIRRVQEAQRGNVA